MFVRPHAQSVSVVVRSTGVEERSPPTFGDASVGAFANRYSTPRSASNARYASATVTLNVTLLLVIAGCVQTIAVRLARILAVLPPAEAS